MVNHHCGDEQLILRERKGEGWTDGCIAERDMMEVRPWAKYWEWKNFQEEWMDGGKEEHRSLRTTNPICSTTSKWLMNIAEREMLLVCHRFWMTNSRCVWSLLIKRRNLLAQGTVRSQKNIEEWNVVDVNGEIIESKIPNSSSSSVLSLASLSQRDHCSKSFKATRHKWNLLQQKLPPWCYRVILVVAKALLCSC